MTGLLAHFAFGEAWPRRVQKQRHHGPTQDQVLLHLGDVGPGSLFLPGVDVGRSDSTSTFTATRQWVSVLEWPQGKVLRVILGVRVR